MPLRHTHTMYHVHCWLAIPPTQVLPEEPVMFLKVSRSLSPCPSLHSNPPARMHQYSRGATVGFRHIGAAA